MDELILKARKRFRAFSIHACEETGYDGYNDLIQKVYKYKQDHLFAAWDTLGEDAQKVLLNQIQKVDFGQIESLFKHAEDHQDVGNFSPAPFINVPVTDEEKKRYEEARRAGIEYIRAGKVAAFIVAGGQGSRLGYEGPKGMYPVGPVTGKSLFQIHGEKILKYSRKYGVPVPWLVMTSEANHNDTENYFKEMKYFGLAPEDVYIFRQNMIPSLDSDGNMVLEAPGKLFRNPDGHGGSLTALHTSGALAAMKDRGIETISYFQVDNPLVKILDPVFIGFHVLEDADISSKAMKKAYPEEKVGVFVTLENGRRGVVEYSDLSDEKAGERDEAGELRYSGGSIAIHLFDRGFVEEITSGASLSLPFHTARKKLKIFKEGSVKEVDGFKFEKFVFDALPLTEKNVIFETLREEEFAPVKNATGIDSVETSRDLMMGLHRAWLAERCIAVSSVVKRLEISPLAAVEPEDLDRGLLIPEEEDVYID